MKKKPTPPAYTSAHCNKCGGARKHAVLFSKRKFWDDSVDNGHNSISGTDTYSLIACGGCETIHVKHDSTFSEDTEPDGSSIVTTNYYPPAMSRRTPAWLDDKDGPFWWGGTEIELLLKEIYSAVQNDSRRLAMMGIRSLLEMIMVEKVGDSGKIGTNVKNFIAEGYIAPKHEDIFRLQIEAGHAGMHRKYVPSATDLDVLLNITESLVEAVYVHPHRAKKLKSIPPWQGKKKAKSKP